VWHTRRVSVRQGANGKGVSISASAESEHELAKASSVTGEARPRKPDEARRSPADRRNPLQAPPAREATRCDPDPESASVTDFAGPHCDDDGSTDAVTTLAFTAFAANVMRPDGARLADPRASVAGGRDSKAAWAVRATHGLVPLDWVDAPRRAFA
jgi:hypothetical protein